MNDIPESELPNNEINYQFRRVQLKRKKAWWQRRALTAKAVRFATSSLLFIRITIIYLRVGSEVLIERAAAWKNFLVSRMFWGRSNLYRVAFHYVIVSISASALLLGLASRLLVVEAQTQQLSQLNSLQTSSDVLQQGSSIQTVVAVDPNTPSIRVTQHVVESGETLAQIAEDNEVSIDTIRWVNSGLISPFSNEIKEGWNLNIPQIDGIFITIEPGQTIDSLVAKYGSGGNVHPIDIVELNRLNPDNPVLEPGQRIFIPSGRLSSKDLGPLDIPVGEFSNALSHPSCGGYTLSRGFTWGHDGLDLARYPGCPIRAIATGDVVFVGCDGAAGCNVRIDHGGGIVSHYYHGDGTFWVKTGDRVQQGQEIMMMGTTGNSTGVHLHLELRKDGIPFDPAPYVPF